MSLSLDYNHSSHSHGMSYSTEYQKASIEVQHVHSMKHELADSHYAKHSCTYPDTISRVPFLNSSKSGTGFPKTEQTMLSRPNPTSPISSQYTPAPKTNPSQSTENYIQPSYRYQKTPHLRKQHHSLSVDSYDTRENVYSTPLRSSSIDSSFNLPRISSENTNLCSSPQRSDLSRSSSYTSASNWSPSPRVTTPPPSLPPLSETLNNIFVESPKESLLSSGVSSTESASTPKNTQFTHAISPLAPSFRSENHMTTSVAQVLPPLMNRHPASQPYQSVAKPGSSTGVSKHPILPSMVEALTMDHRQPLPNSPAFGSADEYSRDEKRMFSFVSLPGVNGKKRPRRKFDEIERLYSCNHSGCTKSYGTLNHLNAHVTMQKHGIKRLPSEFKELRKHWKKQKQSSDY
ncbi:hypothetical protein K7432_010907 [Basidiobolus ranarum]|uniref:C2H2-type domain-containing protein n=1 Tax=Basidiobolus ranarum TaxID=34480 RepID=A0ABR2VUU2_9FUNG